MATEAQILANRRNAQKSTGPQTHEGKAIVSQNAIKHGLTSPAVAGSCPPYTLGRRDAKAGLTAGQVVIFSESQAEFELYRDQMLGELDTASPMESMLAERIVSLSWRLKRVGRIQNQAIDVMNADNKSSPLAKLTKSLFSKGLDRPQGGPSNSDGDLALGRMAIKDFSNARVLERLLMYERRIEHSLYKTILELQRLHLMRKSAWGCLTALDPLRAADEETGYGAMLAGKSRASQRSAASQSSI